VKNNTPDAARVAGLDPHPKLKPSGIDWLGDVPEHWEGKPIKWVAKIGNVSTPGRDNEAHWEGGHLSEQPAMTTEAKRIIDEAMKLEPSARAMIAETLLDSLDVGTDFAISDSWRGEIRRRCAEIDNGNIELIPGERAMQELRAKWGS